MSPEEIRQIRIQYYKEWREKNPHKKIEYAILAKNKKQKPKVPYKDRTREYKDKRNEKSRMTHDKIKEALNERRRQLYRLKMENPDYRGYMLKRTNEWRNKNKSKYRESCAKSSKKHKQKAYDRVKRYRQTNPLYRFKKSIRSRIERALKENDFRKDKKTNEFLGATIDFVKKHLEKQFTKGMTWGNRGFTGWHIDHIIPLSSAKNEEDLIKLFHYTNLQPLWRHDNLTKSNKIPQVQLKLTI